MRLVRALCTKKNYLSRHLPTDPLTQPIFVALAVQLSSCLSIRALFSNKCSAVRQRLKIQDHLCRRAPNDSIRWDRIKAASSPPMTGHAAARLPQAPTGRAWTGDVPTHRVKHHRNTTNGGAKGGGGEQKREKLPIATNRGQAAEIDMLDARCEMQPSSWPFFKVR